MKKIIILFVILIVLFLFRYTLWAYFFHSGVQDVRIFPVYATGTLASNGLRTLIFYPPVFTSGVDSDWRECKVFNEDALKWLNVGIFNIKKNIPPLENFPRKIIYEETEEGYKAYIKFDKTILLNETFSDYSGDIGEKQLCSVWEN